MDEEDASRVSRHGLRKSRNAIVSTAPGQPDMTRFQCVISAS
jgi:hypothetical protein